MHALLLVVCRMDEDLNELMAPWRTELRIPGEWGDPITDKQKRQFLDDYKSDERYIYNDDPESYGPQPDWIKQDTDPDFEKAYAEVGETYNDNAWRKDENGVWRWWHEWEWNPDGIWDGWRIGGRFAGSMNQKEDAIDEPFLNPDPDIWNEKEKAELLKKHPRATDIAYKGDVENLEELWAHSLLMDGKWKNVNGKVYDLIKDVPDDMALVVIDYHTTYWIE